jgi:hypothetical protein
MGVPDPVDAAIVDLVRSLPDRLVDFDPAIRGAAVEGALREAVLQGLAELREIVEFQPDARLPSIALRFNVCGLHTNRDIFKAAHRYFPQEWIDADDQTKFEIKISRRTIQAGLTVAGMIVKADVAAGREEFALGWRRSVKRFDFTPATRSPVICEGLAVTGEPDAKHDRPADHTGSRIPDRQTVDIRAVQMLVEHPDWSNDEIAQAIGCHPKYLSSKKNCPKFRAAREAQKTSPKRPPRGTKSRDGDLEAIGDDDINFDEMDRDQKNR